jgi:hypothetical protein
MLDHTAKDRLLNVLADANVDQMRRLLLLLHISHIILVMEPTCRLDPTLARTLRIANVLR